MQGGVIAGVTSPLTRLTDVQHLASGTCDLAWAPCAAVVGAAMMARGDFITESFVSTFTQISIRGALISTSPFDTRIVTVIPEILLNGDTPPGRGAGQGAGRAAQCHQQRQQQAGERRGDKHGGGGGHSSVQIKGPGDYLINDIFLNLRTIVAFLESDCKY